MGCNNNETDRWYDKVAEYILVSIGYDFSLRKKQSIRNKHSIVFFSQIIVSTAYFAVSVWALDEYSLFALLLSSLLSVQVFIHLIQKGFNEEEEVIKYVRENGLDEDVTVIVPGKRRIILYSAFCLIAIIVATFVFITATDRNCHLIISTICFIVYLTSYLDQLLSIIIESYETNFIIQVKVH